MAPNQTIVSVIMPAYNYGHFIGATIESLQAQTFPHWECVIVDDGSTDNTAEVVAGIAKTDGRIKFVRQQNRRQAAARNNGLTQISGEYVQFLDADDLLEPYKFERQVEYLESHADVDIVYGDTRFFFTERPDELLYSMYGENKRWQPKLCGHGSSMLLPLIRHNSVIICAPLTRRALIERVSSGRSVLSSSFSLLGQDSSLKAELKTPALKLNGVAVFDEELPPLEDWHFWIRCALAGANFQFEDFPGTLSLVRSHQTSSSKDRFRWTTAEVKLRRKLRPLVANDREASRLNAQLLAEAEGTLGALEVLNGHRVRGARYLGKAAVFDKKLRQRLKWLACALAAPVASRRQFEKVYSGSISRGLI